MNLRDSKEPQVSGQITSREQKPLLKSHYCGPIAEHVFDSFGHYIQTNFYKKFTKGKWIDECSELNDLVIIHRK